MSHVGVDGPKIIKSDLCLLRERRPLNAHSCFRAICLRSLERYGPLFQGEVSKAYFLLHFQVVDTQDVPSVLFNKTITRTWVILPNLVPGMAYQASVSGSTTKGWGPESSTMKFSMPAKPNGASGMLNPEGGSGSENGQEFPGFSVETNYYLIIGIVSASLILFMFLFAAIFFIYRHRRKSKGNPYFAKSKLSILSHLKADC